MARRRDTAKFKRQSRQETDPTFTRSEWDEIMHWRMARMIEAGEPIPTLDELLLVIQNVIQKTEAPDE